MKKNVAAAVELPPRFSNNASQFLMAFESVPVNVEECVVRILGGRYDKRMRKHISHTGVLRRLLLMYSCRWDCHAWGWWCVSSPGERETGLRAHQQTCKPQPLFCDNYSSNYYLLLPLTFYVICFVWHTVYQKNVNHINELPAASRISISEPLLFPARWYDWLLQFFSFSHPLLVSQLPSRHTPLQLCSCRQRTPWHHQEHDNMAMC